MKVIHLPTEVGGNSFGLSRAERAIGLESDCLVKKTSWLDYPFDYNLKIDQESSKLARLFMAYKAYLKIKDKYDVFHFNFGTSLIDYNLPFLKYYDLKRYKGRKIMTFNGCDVRQKYITMKTNEICACKYNDCYKGMCNSGQLDRNRRRNIKLLNMHLDHMFFLNPDLGKFLPADKSTFLPYSVARWDELETRSYHLNNKKLRIVHAPTNRVTKGSSFLQVAVERINKKEEVIELVLVEKMPYDKAIEVYQSADLIVDQLLIGWYGAFAVEAMKMGKPVLCYVNMQDAKLIPQNMYAEINSSIINVTPESIEQKLLEILENRDLLKKYRDSALNYVHRWHSPEFVAKEVKQYY